MPRPLSVARDPGTSAIGEEVRRLLKHPPGTAPMAPECELFLFGAGRAQLAREILLPALARGDWVLCDRYLDSTTVYQGVARGLDPDLVAAVNRAAVAGRLPDLTLLLDLDPAEGMRRTRTRTGAGPGPDRFEEEPAAFYREIRAAYLALAAGDPGRFEVIDAAGSADEVECEIWKRFTGRFHGLLDPTGA